MSYEVQVPEIENATITPNPVNINSKFLISVTVTEKTVTLEPVFFYSGEIYSGEDQ